MQYDDLLDRDLEEGFSSSEEEEERPAPPPTHATPTPARATAIAPTYASVVATVARLEMDTLAHAEMDWLRGSRGKGRGRGSRGGTPPPPWRSHRRPRAREELKPWPPRPDQGECKFATLKTYRTTQFNTVLYSLYADLSL